jgi:hypothetical protein
MFLRRIQYLREFKGEYPGWFFIFGGILLMERNNRELWLALLAMFLITLAYVLVQTLTGAIPAAGSLFGHGIGILGFILMLTTETLYTFRKRARQARRWGRMVQWLQFHIFTGLVGPYLVLLHTAWTFNGLAGVLTLLTVVIVVSGVIGRYIYTAVPHTADGVEIEADELERQSSTAGSQLQRQVAEQPEVARLLGGLLALSPQPVSPGLGLVFERSFGDWKYRWQQRQAVRRLPSAVRAQAAQLAGLQLRQRQISRQAASLVTARRYLGLWRTIHMPIGVVLFTTALIHIGAVLYFVTNLR